MLRKQRFLGERGVHVVLQLFQKEGHTYPTCDNLFDECFQTAFPSSDSPQTYPIAKVGACVTPHTIDENTTTHGENFCSGNIPKILSPNPFTPPIQAPIKPNHKCFYSTYQPSTSSLTTKENSPQAYLTPAQRYLFPTLSSQQGSKTNSQQPINKLNNNGQLPKFYSPTTPISAHINPYPHPCVRKPKTVTQPSNRQLVTGMDKMTDEEFLAQFARLNPDEGPSEPSALSAAGIVNRDLSRCALARIISERGVIDAHFTTTMRRAWASHLGTEFINLERNMFLIQFHSESEAHRVMHRGIWNYRGDIVALRRITDPSQLESPSVTTMEVWTQFHRIPAHAVNNEGIYTLARKIGTPLTDVEEAFAAGLRYCKVKILIPIEQPLKEMVQFQHPLFGTQTIYTTYERITKLCAFCARVDHEIGACMDKVRIERLKQDPRFSNRQEL